MNNLFITTLCENRCPYCFGMGKLKHSLAQCGAADFLSLQDARFAADFFQADPVISLLGGEPTLHPEFQTIADLFLDRGYTIFLFTGGGFGAELRDYLLNRKNIFCVVNVNERSSYTPGKWEKLEANLKALRGKVNSLAVTLYRLEQEILHVVDLAAKYDVKAVKIGVAAPSCDGRNRRIPFGQKHLLAGPLLELVTRLSEAGIIPFGECEKLKPCMVESGFAEQLRACGWRGHPFKSKQCLQGGNIDVGPDLKVWRCFPFSRPLGALTDYTSPAQMRSRMKSHFDPILFRAYPEAECYDCPYALSLQCEGGCLKRTMDRARRRLTRHFAPEYSRVIEGWGSRAVACAETSLVFSDWLSEIGVKGFADGNGTDRVEAVLTDLLAEYDPLSPSLLDVPAGLEVFPHLIHVDGIVVETCRNLTTPGWRRTLWQEDDRVLAGPYPVFETDMRTIRWRLEEIAVEPGPHRALLLFYTVFDGDHRRIYTSLSPQGFVGLHPIPQERALNIKNAISPELVPLMGGVPNHKLAD